MLIEELGLGYRDNFFTLSRVGIISPQLNEHALAAYAFEARHASMYGGHSIVTCIM